jgi:hypothetical protein
VAQLYQMDSVMPMTETAVGCGRIWMVSDGEVIGLSFYYWALDVLGAVA